ncbi:MAG TPA: dihydroorotate dehydrogenase (quinone) [Vitreimonas sp.]|nr:dihydroorotate dehydrogenase (quinone) [Vitreimonas sp.]
MQPALSSTTAFLYQRLFKPVVFLMDPEFIHNQHALFGVQLGKVGPAKNMLSWLWSYQNPKLQRTLDGIMFPNPVGLAAGFDYNGDLTGILPAVGFGFHSIGTVTLNAYEGNPAPRLGRFPGSKALLVNKGLKNLGAEKIIDKLSHLPQPAFSIPTGISIASTNRAYKNDTEQIKEIIKCFQLFEASSLSHAYYELNISCPNTFGGEPFTTCPRLEELLQAMDKLNLRKPLYVKMPIDQEEEESFQLLKVIAKHNTQGLILGNLTKDKNNPALTKADLKKWRQSAGNVSGKPTWNRSNRLIKLARSKYKNRFTLIGTGGVFSGKDAQHKLNLGADLVQLITGMIFQGPQLIGQINQYLAKNVR